MGFVTLPIGGAALDVGPVDAMGGRTAVLRLELPLCSLLAALSQIEGEEDVRARLPSPSRRRSGAADFPSHDAFEQELAEIREQDLAELRELDLAEWRQQPPPPPALHSGPPAEVPPAVPPPRQATPPPRQATPPPRQATPPPAPPAQPARRVSADFPSHDAFEQEWAPPPAPPQPEARPPAAPPPADSRPAEQQPPCDRELGDVIDASALQDKEPYLLATFKGHSSGVTTVTWSPDGRSVVTGSSSHTACIWQPIGYQPWHWRVAKTLRSFTDGFKDGYRAVEWSPDGGLLAAIASNGAGMIWCGGGSRSWEVAGKLCGQTGALRALAWSPSGKSLLAGGDDKLARIWQPCARGDPTSWEVVAVLRGHSEPIRAVAWSPDSRQVLTAGLDATAAVWRPNLSCPGWHVAQSLNRHVAPIQAVHWASRGDLLLTAGYDGCCIWRAHPCPDSEQPWRIASFLDCRAVHAAAWSPDSAMLATAGPDGEITLWGGGDERPEPDAWRQVAVLQGHRGVVSSLAWAPGRCDQLLSASMDHTARLWQVPV